MIFGIKLIPEKCETCRFEKTCDLFTESECAQWMPEKKAYFLLNWQAKKRLKLFEVAFIVSLLALVFTLISLFVTLIKAAVLGGAV